MKPELGGGEGPGRRVDLICWLDFYGEEGEEDGAGFWARFVEIMVIQLLVEVIGVGEITK